GRATPPAPRRGASSPTCAGSAGGRPPPSPPATRRARRRRRRGGRPRRASARGRPACSMSAPGAAVAADEVVAARRTPRARGVVRETRLVAPPRGADRNDQEPLLPHLVRPGAERTLAAQRVEYQPLVR